MVTVRTQAIYSARNPHAFSRTFDKACPRYIRPSCAGDSPFGKGDEFWVDSIKVELTPNSLAIRTVPLPQKGSTIHPFAGVVRRAHILANAKGNDAIWPWWRSGEIPTTSSLAC